MSSRGGGAVAAVALAPCAEEEDEVVGLGWCPMARSRPSGPLSSVMAVMGEVFIMV